MNKMREYERGREDGLDLALRIVKQGGLKPWKRNVSSGTLQGYTLPWL